MSSTAVEKWHAVEPRGLAAAILGVTIAFTILCLSVVGLRVYLRLSMRNFGREDWLMCVGTVGFPQGKQHGGTTNIQTDNQHGTQRYRDMGMLYWNRNS